MKSRRRRCNGAIICSIDRLIALPVERGRFAVARDIGRQRRFAESLQ